MLRDAIQTGDVSRRGNLIDYQKEVDINADTLQAWVQNPISKSQNSNPNKSTIWTGADPMWVYKCITR